MQETSRNPNFYKNLMSHLMRLPSCTLITTGITGTDFLQSLLDSHTEILIFNGSLWFYDFWEDSLCTNVDNINLDDLLDEFIGKNIEKFKSRYDWRKRKDCLGENGNDSIKIDLQQFRNLTKALLFDRDISSKSLLLAIYGAYSLSLGQHLEKKTVFLHHIHHAEKLDRYLKDFPDSKIICMTRDPRANFVSGIQHWRKYDKNSDNGGHLLYYISRIFIDAYVLEKYSNDYVVIRIEDLGDKQILEKFCAWLGVSYEDQLTKSTWGGMRWRGDRVSSNENEVAGWSAKMLNNSWETKLSLTDKYLFNFLLNSRLNFYGYPYRHYNALDFFITPILIFFPLSFELRYFSLSYISNAIKNNEIKKIIVNCVSYFKRVALFYKFYKKEVGGFKFSRELIKNRD
jgi:hypothetical protein